MTRQATKLTAGAKRSLAAGEPTIAASFALALIDLAVAKGAPRKDLIARASLSPSELADRDQRVPYSKYVKLMRAGKELSGDPALALHFGESFDLAELSIVGLLGFACETIAEAMVQTRRYATLIADAPIADRLIMSREPSGLWLVDTRENPNEFPELTESAFARMASTSKRFGTSHLLKALHFTHAEPSYRAEYDRIFFNMPITFGSDRNALLMDSDDSWLQWRFPAQPRYAFGIFSERAEALLKRLEASKSLRSKVESLLMPILHTGDAGMDKIAAKLGLSRRTLARRLKDEGAVFEEVLDELRHKLAVSYLSEKKVSVNETAYLVGFSEPAAFSRAFKRWTGKTPSAARSARRAPPRRKRKGE